MQIKIDLDFTTATDKSLLSIIKGATDELHRRSMQSEEEAPKETSPKVKVDKKPKEKKKVEVNKGTAWTDKELEILEENFKGWGAAKRCAELLPGRSGPTIYKKASQLGLSRKQKNPKEEDTEGKVKVRRNFNTNGQMESRVLWVKENKVLAKDQRL